MPKNVTGEIEGQSKGEKMTKFPCDYCGGREMELNLNPPEPGEVLTTGEGGPTEIYAMLSTWDFEELGETNFTICPWCLKKVFDTVLKPKKEKR